MTQLKKLAGQTAIYGLSSIVGRLLNYFLVPLYTRVFVPEEYGVVTELYTYVAFFLIIYTYGTETAYFRFVQNKTNSLKVFSTAMWSLAGTSFLLSGSLILFSQPIATFIDYPNHSEYISWFGLILGMDALSTIPFAKLRQENKALKFVFIKLVNIAVNIAGNLFFLVMCPYLIARGLDGSLGTWYDPAIGVGYVFLSNLMASAVALVLLIPTFKDIRWEFDKSLWREMIVYALPLLVAGFAGMINEALDRIMLKYFLPAGSNTLADIGIYGANYKLAIFMTLFIQTFRYAAEPFFFSQAHRQDAQQTYARVMNYFIIAGALIFLAVMVYLDIIKDLLGSDYHEGVAIVPILLMANLCLGIYYNLSAWYKITGKTMYGAYIAIMGAGITIVLNIILIPRMGYMGSAWTTLACYAAMMVVSYIAGQKFYPVPYSLPKAAAYVGLAIALVWIHGALSAMLEASLMLSASIGTALLLTYIVVGFVSEKPKLNVP